jgi:hypothetical protein
VDDVEDVDNVDEAVEMDEVVMLLSWLVLVLVLLEDEDVEETGIFW